MCLKRQCLCLRVSFSDLSPFRSSFSFFIHLNKRISNQNQNQHTFITAYTMLSLQCNGQGLSLIMSHR